MAEQARDLRLITFRVGPETYVLDIMAVRQIIPYNGSAPVPNAPVFIEGIIVLRNEVIPIVDLRGRLHPELKDAAERPLVLITLSSAGVIGLKVDEVRRIVNVTSDQLLPPPPIIRGVRGELLIAVIPQGDEIYLLMDVENVLSATERQELATADLKSQEKAEGRRQKAEVG
jgi:purine-binding chemotaxis protein CheW